MLVKLAINRRAILLFMQDCGWQENPDGEAQDHCQQSEMHLQ